MGGLPSSLRYVIYWLAFLSHLSTFESAVNEEVTMHLSCTNRECAAELKYLRGGRLFLMECEPKNMTGCSKKPIGIRKYFWLCESCATQYVIRRWTEEGVEIRARPVPKSVRPIPMPAQNWTMPGLVG